MLKFEIKDQGDHYLISLMGDLDIYSCNDLKDQVTNTVTEEAKDIIFDARDLEYIDSTGLGVLISIYKRIRQADKTIKLTEVKPNVYKIFEITDLDKIFQLEAQ